MTAQTSFTPRGRSVMTLRVTSYENGCMKGRLSSPQAEGETEFNSTIDLLLQMQQCMDESNGPQRNEEARRFPGSAPAPTQERPAGAGRIAPMAVFQVNIMFRQNATWQGSLLWADEDEEAHFRSVLELLILLNSALTSGRRAGECDD